RRQQREDDFPLLVRLLSGRVIPWGQSAHLNAVQLLKTWPVLACARFSLAGEMIMKSIDQISRFVARFLGTRPRKSRLRFLLQVLWLPVIWGLAPGITSADQMQGTIVITDLTEDPVQAVVSGGTLQINSTILATRDKPETLDFSAVRFIDKDGKVLVDKDTGQE